MTLTSTFSLLCYAAALVAARSNVLLVLPTTDDIPKYSHLASTLESRGHSVVYRAITAASPRLYENGQPAFDHTLFFTPSQKNLPEDLAPQRLVEFLIDGGNLLVATSTESSELWRDFAREFDIDFDDKGTQVLDYFSSSSQLDTIQVSPTTNQLLASFTSAKASNQKVTFKGIGHRRGSNPLLVPVLDANPTSISQDINSSTSLSEAPFIVGSGISLVSAFQTRENSRVVFAGSVELFQDVADETFSTKASNQAFVKDLTQWLFREHGVIRVIKSKYTGREGDFPKQVRVNEQLTYELEVQGLQNGIWGPFDVSDVQLEFTMLDPHIRTTLTSSHKSQSSSSSDSTLLKTTFRAPDRHGVFTLRIDYRRPALSFLQQTHQFSVTPLQHDEYPRFIGGATPYYTGATNVMVAFALFSIVWIAHVPEKKQ